MTAEKPAVLDASALLAFLHREPGAELVRSVLSRAVMSAVNLSEVASKLIDRGMLAPRTASILGRLPMRIYSFDVAAAHGSAALRSRVPKDVSFGDRACLALAAHLDGEALTADTSWARLQLPRGRVTLIR